MATLLRKFEIVQAEPLNPTKDGVTFGVLLDRKLEQMVSGEDRHPGALVSIGVELTEAEWPLIERMYGISKSPKTRV